MSDTTLLDLLVDAAHEAPGQVVVHVRPDGSELTVTLRELVAQAWRVAGGLRAAGVEPGTCLPLVADRSEDFQQLFWGALAAGLVPVPLAADAHRVLPVREQLGRPPVVVDEACEAWAAQLPGSVEVLRLDELRKAPPLVRPAACGPDDLAFVQFSSGSTGSPKGVELTHRAVLANLEQIRAASALTAGDVVVSWMPYFHDMGLIGTHLAPLAARAKQVKIGPMTFARRPGIWFETAAAHRATVLSAANFALALVVRRVPDEAVARLDLTSVRLLLVGAEPISAAVWRDFARKTRPAGLRSEAAQPVYGLAEATLAVAFPSLGEVAEPLVLDRAALSTGLVVDADRPDGAVELMDVGRPVPGCAVRIVDDEGHVLDERRVGHIEVRGPQLARGYHRQPDVTAETFRDGWVRTGDLGFLRDGRLCVSGRHKDVLFLNGRSFHAPDLEGVAATTPGLPPGTPAVVGSTDPVHGDERVVVFVPWARPPATAPDVLERLAARVGEVLYHDDVRVLALPPAAFPRTTSGKLRRHVMRTRFEAGEYADAVAHPPVAAPSGRKPHTSEADGSTGPRGAAGDASTRPGGTPRSRTETERAVRDVWSTVLGVPASAVGDEDTFRGLGGTSLKAMEVLAALEDTLGVVLEPSVMRQGTVAALADHVITAEHAQRAAGTAPPAGRTGLAARPRPPHTSSGVAVVGMSCRFPGADTPEAFWDLLVQGRDLVTTVPADRWNDTAPDPRPTERWGAFLDDPAAFDAACFGIGDEEAETLDPQARVFLELAHEAMERAGYAGTRRGGHRVGVFAAVGDSGYREVLRRALGEDTAPAALALTGNLPNLVAARVSQVLDLDGPAMAVDTACSSALVALHLARRSLLDGECDLALVGGVNLHLTPHAHRMLEAAQALSPTGRSRAFSTAADGFVPGEGGAVLVLRRLDDARRGDDEVLAVVRGTAVNNDGTSLGLMAPNPRRQHEVITAALEAADVDPAAVTYVEAHGTGTAIGDPTELQSLSHAFPARADGRPRLLGSVKTNIGHLLNAAALPALVKTVLALRHGRLPASLHSAPASPLPEHAGFQVVTETTAWVSDGPRVAGINAFGFGGTNAHAVVEQAPEPVITPEPADAAPGPRLLTLSAASESALHAAVRDLDAHLRDHPEIDEADACLTAGTARDDKPYRLAVLADGDLRGRLAALAARRPAQSGDPAATGRGEGSTAPSTVSAASPRRAGEHPTASATAPGADGTSPVRGSFTGRAGSRPRVVFLFPGQGTQRPAVARALHATAGVVQDTVEEASRLLGPIRGRTLADWCLDEAADPAELARTEVAQPLLVTFGVALARQLRDWGVEPDAVAGHSVGEITAACVGGTLSLEDAVTFAAERGRLMGALTEPGAMAAVRGGEDVVAGLVAASRGRLAVAARNGRDRLVISGSEGAVRRALEELSERGVAARRLRVSHAFHSPLMEPVAGPLEDAARRMVPTAASVPLLSTLTADWQPSLDAAHLRAHALYPVLFGASVDRLLAAGYDTFVELGPGAELSHLVRAIARDTGDGTALGTIRTRDVVTLPVATEVPADGAVAVRATHEGLLEVVGRLWVRGAGADRTALAPGGRRVALPTYPYQRARHWPERATSRLLHRVIWRDAPAPTVPAGQGPGAAGRVVVTGPDRARVRELEQSLAERGARVVRPDGPADTADTVVVLAGSPGAGRAVTGAVERAALHEALALLDRTGAGHLLLLTEDAHATGRTATPPRPAQALLAGLALAVAPETPGVRVTAADLSSLDSPAQRLEAVLTELGTPHGAAAHERPATVAWRAGHRLTRGVEPLTDVRPGRHPLPADGTYLITGGAGGIGGALARDLARRGRPTLILTGRSPQPPTGLLQDLAALGATARYVTGDVSVEEDVVALLSRLARLDAVFHAAGVVRPGSLRATTAEESAATFAAKTDGTRLLARVLRRQRLRPAICVAFSSVSSVLPGLAGGLGDYAGANAYLDAFAAAERLAGRPWTALNLGPFAGTGLAAELPAGGLSPRGGRALSTADALDALRTACALDPAQLVVADLAAPTPETAPRSSAALPAALGPTRSAPARPHPGRTAASFATTAVTGTVLRTLLAEALSLDADAVTDDQPFLSLGLDSLTAVDLVKRLERELDRTLPATLFFEHRTVRELAAHLDARPAAEAGSPLTPEDPGRPTVPCGTPFPLTPVQLALHTSSRLYPDLPARGWVRQTVTGPLDTDLLGRALAALADRHPMLRLRVRDDEGQPAQLIADATPVSGWYEVHERGERGAAPQVEKLEAALANRPFDLAAEPPLRALVLRESADLAHLVLVIHHVAGDGYSLNVLATELWALYSALARGRAAGGLPSLRTDFAVWAAADSEPSAARVSDLAHWSDLLSRRGAPLALPYDGDAAHVPSAPLTAHPGLIDEEVTAALRRRAADHDVTLFHLLLAAYVRCLARWSGRRDVTVNVARARRDARLDGLDRLVGPLADTLPLLCDVDPDEPLAALARRLRGDWLECERHGTLTSLDVARLVPVEHPGPRTASPASFSLAHFPATPAADCPVAARPTAAGTGSAATRLGLLCWEDGPLLRLSWNVPVRLFTPRTLARMSVEYREELVEFARPTDRTTARDRPLDGCAATEAEPEPEQQGAPSANLVARLLDRFRATPDALAVDSGTARLTYAALDEASGALAARLRAQGVARGHLVGLLTEPGADTVTGVVGILRAGAGWVPLDASHPRARLTEQLARTGAHTVVHDAATREAAGRLTGTGLVPIEAIPPEAEAPHGRASGPAPAPPPADATAYVIFTSGSTGRPKAVPITHRSMENYLDWSVRTFGYGPGDRLANTASPCFDASVRQLLAPLLAGATVVPVPGALVRDPELLLDHVEQARITVWSSVPSLWERLLTAAEAQVGRGGTRPDLSALRWIHVGGEALPANWVRRWFDLFGEGPRVSNLYGPTETTINATCHIIGSRPGDEVRTLPIGRPVAGTELLVAGPGDKPAAHGEAGELLISGIGLSPGYLGDPALTDAAFVVRDGRRWYRSGDRARLREDGTLEFLGRLDDQVKIRGHRVEPGEVEAALRTHPDVAHAIALADNDRLVAFVTSVPDAAPPSAVALRRHLADSLPPYMLPARITPVTSFPLTGTGKIDRRALLGPRDGGPSDTPSKEEPARGASLPVTPTEVRLAAVWRGLLDVDVVHREDDFFELGGDSLLILRVFARLEEHGSPLPRPTVVYAHRTLAALAAVLDTAQAGNRADTPGAAPHRTDGPGPSDPFPVTPGQRGFLLAEALAPGTDSSWLARLTLTGEVKSDLFQSAVDTLVARHPMLRTVFPAGARPPVQQELPATLRLPVDFETLDGPHQVQERITAERCRRLEPWAWPLLRLRLLTLAPRQHVLIVHAHHLIGDGYSAALLITELTAVYDALAVGEPIALPALRGTFRDHAVRLAAIGTEPASATGVAPDEADETDETDERRARLEAPYPRPRLRGLPHRDDVNKAGTGPYVSHDLILEADQVARLRRMAADAGATLHAPVLTAYYRALTRLTGQDDLIIGLAVTGRDNPQPDIDRVFGPYARAVPVRPARGVPGSASGRPRDFTEDLRRILTESVDAQRHTGVTPRDAHGLPLTSQFFFTFLDFTALGSWDARSLRVSWDDGGSEFTPPAAGTDVFMAARPEGDRLRITVRASSAALTAQALADFAEALHADLTAATDVTTGRSAPRPVTTTPRPVTATRSLDAALVGYLPAPAHLARLAGIPEAALPREDLRALLFPDGGPRLLETVVTPLGRSGFVALPRFADELAGGVGLVAHTARAVDLASREGARCVSLAGIIPSLTGYGFDVLRATSAGSAAVTTGHAATVVSVVKTVHAVLDTTGQDLADLDVAVVGLGSIGASSLELLLDRGPRPPRRLLLCDAPGSGPRLRDLADRLRGGRGPAGIDTVESTPSALPPAVYEADLIIAAVSGGGTLLDIDRLRPGTTVVDDSFPHCFDTGRALTRMRERGDVLVVGGGLLAVGATERHLEAALPAGATADHLARQWLEGTLASCRAESLLHASGADVPLVHGLVHARTALDYWNAMGEAGLEAAPPHLHGSTVDPHPFTHARRTGW
ncbi:non-ribosomal peptide synthetase/type I polyketide synthase [Streptomyces rishiriensis]|uniref:Amino acid adenylation domain-containing protein n=1 Tax=Streptomyces rishiriensis TaxID=68264 RepID=A0ABU0NHS5_STRRH|nr:non-ribosomal peptide synthetase/type I polyketide synthase [Streptomyces rishiriensis]MDQ0578634.1 amino acid adenylation domain-containing protein [Streptomyces rishiriensis]